MQRDLKEIKMDGKSTNHTYINNSLQQLEGNSIIMNKSINVLNNSESESDIPNLKLDLEK